MAKYVKSLGEQYERELAHDTRCAKPGARCLLAWVCIALKPLTLTKSGLKERALLMEKARAEKVRTPSSQPPTPRRSIFRRISTLFRKRRREAQDIQVDTLANRSPNVREEEHEGGELLGESDIETAAPASAGTEDATPSKGDEGAEFDAGEGGSLSRTEVQEEETGGLPAEATSTPPMSSPAPVATRAPPSSLAGPRLLTRGLTMRTGGTSEQCLVAVALILGACVVVTAWRRLKWRRQRLSEESSPQPGVAGSPPDTAGHAEHGEGAEGRAFTDSSPPEAAEAVAVSLADSEATPRVRSPSRNREAQGHPEPQPPPSEAAEAVAASSSTSEAAAPIMSSSRNRGAQGPRSSDARPSGRHSGLGSDGSHLPFGFSHEQEGPVQPAAAVDPPATAGHAGRGGSTGGRRFAEPSKSGVSEAVAATCAATSEAASPVMTSVGDRGAEGCSFAEPQHPPSEAAEAVAASSSTSEAAAPIVSSSRNRGAPGPRSSDARPSGRHSGSSPNERRQRAVPRVGSPSPSGEGGRETSAKSGNPSSAFPCNPSSRAARKVRSASPVRVLASAALGAVLAATSSPCAPEIGNVLPSPAVDINQSATKVQVAVHFQGPEGLDGLGTVSAADAAPRVMPATANSTSTLARTAVACESVGQAKSASERSSTAAAAGARSTRSHVATTAPAGTRRERRVRKKKGGKGGKGGKGEEAAAAAAAVAAGQGQTLPQGVAVKALQRVDVEHSPQEPGAAVTSQDSEQRMNQLDACMPRTPGSIGAHAKQVPIAETTASQGGHSRGASKACPAPPPRYVSRPRNSSGAAASTWGASLAAMGMGGSSRRATTVKRSGGAAKSRGDSGTARPKVIGERARETAVEGSTERRPGVIGSGGGKHGGVKPNGEARPVAVGTATNRGYRSNDMGGSGIEKPRVTGEPARKTAGGDSTERRPGVISSDVGGHGSKDGVRPNGNVRSIAVDTATKREARSNGMDGSGIARPRVVGERARETAGGGSTARRPGVIGSGGREHGSKDGARPNGNVRSIAVGNATKRGARSNASAARSKDAPRQKPEAVHPAATGLLNSKKDNQCGLNAVLQLMRHTPRVRTAVVAWAPRSKGGGQEPKPSAALMNPAETATIGVGKMFQAMENEKNRKGYQVHSQVLKAVYDGTFLRRGRQEDAHQVLLRLLDLLSEASKGNSATALELRKAMDEMTHEVSSQRTCSCGFESRVRGEKETGLTVPLEYQGARTATPSVKSLLEAKFQNELLDACHQCQGLAEVNTKKADLLTQNANRLKERAALVAVVAAAEAYDVPRASSFLKEAYETLGPWLGSPSCALRETVTVANLRLRHTLSSGSLSEVEEEMKRQATEGGVDEAVVMLLQASLQTATAAREAATSSDLIDSAVKELESLEKISRTGLAGRAEGKEGARRNQQTVRTWLNNSPETMMLYLMRFTHEGGAMGGAKRSERIDIPLELDMAAYTGQPTKKTGDKAPQPTVYTLDGVLHHKGESINSGHYVAYVRTSSNKWRCYNDANVKDGVAESEALSKNALMLSYTRRPL